MNLTGNKMKPLIYLDAFLEDHALLLKLEDELFGDAVLLLYVLKKSADVLVRELDLVVLFVQKLLESGRQEWLIIHPSRRL